MRALEPLIGHVAVLVNVLGKKLIEKSFIQNSLFHQNWGLLTIYNFCSKYATKSIKDSRDLYYSLVQQKLESKIGFWHWCSEHGELSPKCVKLLPL